MNEFKLKPQQYWLLKDGTWSKSEPPYDQVVQTIRAIPVTFYEIVLDERDQYRALLKEAKDVLDKHWFHCDEWGESNNEDVIEMSRKIEDILK